MTSALESLTDNREEMRVLVLIAATLRAPRGLPGEIVDIGTTIEELIVIAERGEHLGRPAAHYDVCAIWKLRSGRQPQRVARRRPGYVWLDANGELLYDLRALTMPESSLDPDTRLFPLPLWDTDANDP